MRLRLLKDPGIAVPLLLIVLIALSLAIVPRFLEADPDINLQPVIVVR